MPPTKCIDVVPGPAATTPRLTATQPLPSRRLWLPFMASFRPTTEQPSAAANQEPVLLPSGPTAASSTESS